MSKKMGLESLCVSVIGVTSVSKLADVPQHPVGWRDPLDIGYSFRQIVYHHQAEIPFPTTATI